MLDKQSVCEKEEGRGGGAHRGGARRPCDSLVATEVAGVEEDSGDPRKKRWRGGGGVERRRALVPRLAGPALKQILPAALPVASHGGARGTQKLGACPRWRPQGLWTPHSPPGLAPMLWSSLLVHKKSP